MRSRRSSQHGRAWSRSRSRRTRSARSPMPGGCRQPRTTRARWLGRRRAHGSPPPRRPRRHRRRRTAHLPVQVLRAASRRRRRARRPGPLAAGRPGPSRAGDASGPSLRDRHALPRSARRVRGRDRVPRVARVRGRGPACPPGSGLCADRGPRARSDQADVGAVERDSGLAPLRHRRSRSRAASGRRRSASTSTPARRMRSARRSPSVGCSHTPGTTTRSA